MDNFIVNKMIHNLRPGTLARSISLACTLASSLDDGWGVTSISLRQGRCLFGELVVNLWKKCWGGNFPQRSSNTVGL